MRCFTLKAFVVSAQKQKKQAAETGEGTLRYCEGMGRDLPAGRAAGGAERLRLPAAVADALHAANNRTLDSILNRLRSYCPTLIHTTTA